MPLGFVNSDSTSLVMDPALVVDSCTWRGIPALCVLKNGMSRRRVTAQPWRTQAGSKLAPEMVLLGSCRQGRDPARHSRQSGRRWAPPLPVRDSGPGSLYRYTAISSPGDFEWPPSSGRVRPGGNARGESAGTLPTRPSPHVHSTWCAGFKFGASGPSALPVR